MAEGSTSGLSDVAVTALPAAVVTSNGTTAGALDGMCCSWTAPSVGQDVATAPTDAQGVRETSSTSDEPLDPSQSRRTSVAVVAVGVNARVLVDQVGVVTVSVICVPGPACPWSAIMRSPPADRPDTESVYGTPGVSPDTRWRAVPAATAGTGQPSAAVPAGRASSRARSGTNGFSYTRSAPRPFGASPSARVHPAPTCDCSNPPLVSVEPRRKLTVNDSVPMTAPAASVAVRVMVAVPAAVPEGTTATVRCAGTSGRSVRESTVTSESSWTVL